MRVRDQSNFASGLLFIAVGFAFSAMSWRYKLGTAERMGPGYFPFWLGAILALLGAALVFASMQRSRNADKLERWNLKCLTIILGAALAFAVLLPIAGFMVALATLIVISSFAAEDFHWGVTAANTVILLVMCYSIFVYALNVPFPLWPRFW